MTAPAISGLSYRVRVEHHGLGYAPENAALSADGHLTTFDYLRVTGDSVEEALDKVHAHHVELFQAPPRCVQVYFLGYNIDGRPVPSLQTLASFEQYGDSGYEWTVGFAGSDETTRWRTDHHGQGLWRWDNPGWTQVRGHLQYKVAPKPWGAGAGPDEARRWLLHRWGLSEAEALADADLLTSAQVLELLRQLGRPITAGALRNYHRRPPTGWPQPVKRIGRTPLWSRAAVEAYATA